jgi:hypothetical protein
LTASAVGNSTSSAFVSSAPATQLGDDVDRRVGRLDLAQREHRGRDRGVEVRATDQRKRLDQHEQHEDVHQADDRKVDERQDARCLRVRGRDEERDHHRDEEHEGEGADELS